MFFQKLPQILATALLSFVSINANTQIRIFSCDESLYESNISKPRIYIANTGSEPISGFKIYYYFSTENHKNPIVDSYYVPDGNIVVENIGSNQYRIIYDYTSKVLMPNTVFPNTSGSVIGIHYSDWSVFDKSNDFSNNQRPTFSENQNIAVYINGNKLYGNEPIFQTSLNPPSSALLDYSLPLYEFAIFAENQIDLRDRIHINGSLGANLSVVLGCDDSIKGSISSGTAISIRDRGSIKGDVITGGGITIGNEISITGKCIENSIIEKNMIPRKLFPTGSSDINLSPGTKFTLNPSNYRDIHLFSRDTLLLSAGTYNIRKLIIEPDVQVYITDTSIKPVILNIQEDLQIGDRTKLCFLQNENPVAFQIYSNQRTVLRVGADCSLKGFIIAPECQIQLNSRVEHVGAIYCKDIIVESDVNIYLPPILASLSLSTGSYAPFFDFSKLNYFSAVSPATNSVLISPLASDNQTTITINGFSPPMELSLPATTNLFKIELKRKESNIKSTYIIEIQKKSPYAIFVNDNSPCLNQSCDGSSWSSAYKNIQQAIVDASQSGKEIWVAEGVYKPSYQSDSLNARSVTFNLQAGVDLIGGFVGTEVETYPLGSPYKTVISGDMYGNDSLITYWPPVGFSDSIFLNDNALHVVTIKNHGKMSGISLRGFTIQGGYANKNTKDCIGGGILCQGKLPNLNDCIVKRNISLRSGSGVFATEAPDSIYNCLFYKNVSLSGSGAGVFINSGNNFILYSTIFANNLCADTNNAFGAGITLNCEYSRIINTVFSRNKSEKNGGALFNLKGKIDLVNSTFSNNYAKTGPQSIFNYSGKIDIVNSILWNDAMKSEVDTSGVKITYSCIKSWNGIGIGNKLSDPLFTNSNNPEGIDSLYGTADDGLLVQSSSPCINSGLHDTLAPTVDILQTEREMPDIGAYEYFATQDYEKIFGYLNKNGDFVPEDGIHVIDKIWHWWYVSIYAKSNHAAVAQVLVKKDKYTKSKNKIYTYLYSLDNTGNIISTLPPVKIDLYKTGERDGVLVFQTKTISMGKPIVFVEDASYHNWNNNWAYIVCAKSPNFKAVTPNSQF